MIFRFDNYYYYMFRRAFKYPAKDFSDRRGQLFLTRNTFKMATSCYFEYIIINLNKTMHIAADRRQCAQCVWLHNLIGEEIVFIHMCIVAFVCYY